MPDNSPHLCLHNISKRFGDITALHEVSLDIPRGSIVGLLGANGAGKSTLAKIVVGLLQPSTGRVCMDGSQQPHEFKRRIGYLPQSGLPLRHVCARDALQYTAILRGMTRKQAAEQAQWLLTELGLTNVASRSVHKLSGGQMRMTNFGMALAGNPDFLLLDEPTTGLDVEHREHFWRVIHNLPSQNKTVFIIEHNLWDIERTADLFLILRGGRLVYQGHLHEIIASLQWRISIRFVHGKPDRPPEGFELSQGTWMGWFPPAEIAAKQSQLIECYSQDIVEISAGLPSLKDIYLEQQSHP